MIYLFIIIMHILCILVDNNFLFLQTHTGDLTLNSNVTCDSQETVTCIGILQDDITLDCNGYSIIGPGADIGTGIRVIGSNFIVKNCNVEQFLVGIDNDAFSTSTTVESSTLSNNEIGIAHEQGSLTLKNVLAENNRVGLSLFRDAEVQVVIDNAYLCNNSDEDISVGPSAGGETCPEVEATGHIFASAFESRDCPPIEDAINDSLEENGFGPIKSCTDLVAQQSLLSDM